MKHSEIPVLPTDTKTTERSAGIRKKAPDYLQSLIQDSKALPFVSSIESLHPDQISPLGGGQDAATYLLLYEGAGFIIKFDYYGIEAEVEALRAWASKSVHVPKVISHGVVPSTKHSTKPVRYLVEEALVDKHGRLAETCETYLQHSPTKARHIGRLMGKELIKIHSCISTRSFGDFADSEGNTAPYRSWNKYLLDYFAIHKNYLQKLGVNKEDISVIDDHIRDCTFVKEGRYLHGDFSIRNTAIQPYRDKVFVFDPNPVVGDPSWDVAVLFNNLEFSKRHKEVDKAFEQIWHRNQQLLMGFNQGYERKVETDNLLTAQLIQGILHAQYHESKVKEGTGDRRALKVRQDTLRDLVVAICGGK